MSPRLLRRRGKKGKGQLEVPPTLMDPGESETIVLGEAPEGDVPPTRQGASVSDGTARLPAAYAARFTGIRPLGSGSTGDVYAAYDVALDRPVALKALQRMPTGVPLHAFAQREARAVAGLHHPGIVTLYDWIEDQDTAWLVLEYVPGPSLAGVLKAKGPLPPEEAARICIRVCEALQYAHGQGIWHLDIKPANVLCSGDAVKVTDFGIARRSLPGAGGQWALGRGANAGHGTPGFAAPEQLQGTPTAQSDIYAIGALFFALLTGEGVPGPGAKRAWGAIPRVWRPVLRAALSPLPRDRPPSPRALADAIAQTMGDHQRPERGWDTLLAGVWAGAVAWMATGVSPIAVATPGQGVLAFLGLAALAIARPASSVLLALLGLTAVLCWRVPTLGVLLILAWPVFAPLTRLFPRGMALLFLAPFFRAAGLMPAFPIVVGSLLKGPAVALVGGGGALLAAGLQSLVTLPVVQSYLSAAATRLPAPTMLGQILAVVSEISPRDLVTTLLPGLLYGASSAVALWAALVAVAAALCTSWAKGRWEVAALAGMIGFWCLVQEALPLAWGEPFRAAHFVASCALAILVVEASPARH